MYSKSIMEETFVYKKKSSIRGKKTAHEPTGRKESSYINQHRIKLERKKKKTLLQCRNELGHLRVDEIKQIHLFQNSTLNNM